MKIFVIEATKKNGQPLKKRLFGLANENKRSLIKASQYWPNIRIVEAEVADEPPKKGR